MRTVTFNIRHGVGIDGRLDLARTAETIAALEPDVVGLQEVDRHWAERSGFVDQAGALARRLRMRVAYGATLDLDPPEPGRPRRRYGNAVLARFPILGASNRLLPHTSDVEQRGLLRARVRFDDLAADVYVTHLEPQDAAQRSLQAAAVATFLAINPRPRILLADLNAEPGRPELTALAAVLRDAWAAGVGRGRTYPANAPTRRIDAVFHSPDLVAVSAAVPWTTASDHRPVLAVLTPTPTPRPTPAPAA